MKRASVAVVFLLLALPFAQSSGQPETEDVKLQTHFKQYLDAQFKLHPTLCDALRQSRLR